MKKRVFLFASFVISMLALGQTYNQNIVAIFGSGNPDTGWTVSQVDNITLALRAKNRVTASTLNVDGVYLEPAGLVPPNNNRAFWNFELSVSSGGTPLTPMEPVPLGSIEYPDYYLVIDQDPSTGNKDDLVVSVLDFWSDNSFGTGSTLNGQGIEGLSWMYSGVSTIVQQSQNIMFYPGMTADDATYLYTLYAVPSGSGSDADPVVSVSITVIVGVGGVPDADGDGVLDDVDLCPGTGPSEVVNAHGCSIYDLVETCADEAKNHGDYVSCVTLQVKQLLQDEIIDKETAEALIKEAAESDIGKKSKEEK